jgi:Zn-dependent protease with chaperone function
MTNHPPSLRLNPFLFPAETDFRFLLLIAAALGTSLAVYGSLVNAFLRSEFGQTVLRCGFDNTCWDPFERKEAMLMAGGLLVVFLVAYLIYWMMPGWIIHRRRLIPLTDEDGPEMLLYLNRLCQQIDLREAPMFLLDPANPSVTGLAFGRRGRYYIVLSGGLIRYYYTDEPAFQSIVLHELAHLKNADVDKTYFTMAIWYAFLIAAVAPFAISLASEIARFGASEFSLTIQVAWRLAVLAVLVYAVRNSVLRMREFYADVQAAAHADSVEPLTRVLAKSSSAPGQWQPFGPVHPLPEQRQQVLADALPLFGVGFGEALSAGLAIAIAVHNTVFWLTLLLPVQNEPAAYPMALVLFTPLAIGTVGLGVWRSAFAAVTLGIPSQPLGWISLGLGVGLAAGRMLSLDAAREAMSANEQWLAVLVSDLCWGMFLAVTLYLFLRWTQASATTWFATVTSPLSLRRATVVSFVICTALLSWWLGGILLATEISHTLATESLAAILMVWQTFFAPFVVSWPLGFSAMIMLCIFPLIGWLVRRHKGASLNTHWAFLDFTLGETTAVAVHGEDPGQ